MNQWNINLYLNIIKAQKEHLAKLSADFVAKYGFATYIVKCLMFEISNVLCLHFKMHLRMHFEKKIYVGVYVYESGGTEREKK